MQSIVNKLFYLHLFSSCFHLTPALCKSGKFIKYEHFYSSNFTTPIRHKHSIYQRIACLNVNYFTSPLTHILLHLLSYDLAQFENHNYP